VGEKLGIASGQAAVSLRALSRRAMREPLSHFLLVGVAIYALYALAGPADDDAPDRITVTAGEIEWIASSWEKRWNRPPTPEEQAGLIDDYVRETILYREALAMGLDRDDVIVRRRLAQKLEFLVQDLAATTPPTEDELRAYLAGHRERYARPALTTFTQVFLDPAERGDQTLEHGEALLAELRALGASTAQAAGRGDPFMLQAHHPERSELEISKLFGAEFARKVMDLEPGQWRGPVHSGYGMHLVYVDARSDAVQAELAEVRDRVERDWEEERRRVFNEEYIERLRARYEVVIEDATADDFAALPEETP
jgi:hypothetical protein